MTNDIEKLQQALRSANDMCRGFHSVVERNGFDTNWSALSDQLGKSLIFQHHVMYPENYENYATDESDQTIMDILQHDKLSASEALFGFCSWLTTRNSITEIGASKECGPIVDLITQFMKENRLTKPREGWHHNLIHPSGECSYGNEGNIGYEPPGEDYSWEVIARGLYKILDDIDTASDHYKPEKSKYSHYVMKKVREKGDYMWSDGYEVFPRDFFPVEPGEKADPMIEYFEDCAIIEKSYDESNIWIDDLRAVPCKKATIDLHQTTDASIWASEFCKTFEHLYKTDIDHEWVHSWMANAIMCGWDHQSWKRDKEYIYILKTRGGDILKVFHWEPTEKDVREAYTDYYPEDLTSEDYDTVIWNYIQLFRWSRSHGLTEMNGPKSETQYEWKAVNQ